MRNKSNFNATTTKREEVQLVEKKKNMSKALIKVYFNSGCTTLMYNESTTVEDIIRLVIKGRLSLNELRYRQCFKLRSTRLCAPFKDFDPILSVPANAEATSSTTASNTSVDSTSLINSKIDEFFWLRNDQTIKEWLHLISHLNDTYSGHDAVDYWKLQLKIRYISSDLNEVRFKDPITFSYFHEQIVNDYVYYLAPNLADSELIPVLLDLGCLEMRSVKFEIIIAL